MKRDLLFEETYPYPPERVWRALTEPAAIADWLMPNDFQPVVGHRFRFTAPPQPGWDGIVHCEVIEVDPPKTLAYTWKSNAGLDTVCRFRLERLPQGTRLRLEHTGFRGAKALMISFILGSGWKGIVAKHIPAVVARLGEGEYVSVKLERACHQ